MSDPFRTQAVKCLDCESLRKDLRGLANIRATADRLEKRLLRRNARVKWLMITGLCIGGWVGGMVAGFGLLIAMVGLHTVVPVAVPLVIGLVAGGLGVTVGGAFAIHEHLWGEA